MVYNRNAPLVRIYRNDVIVQGRSVLVDLKAASGDPYAIGAQATLTCDGRSTLRQVAAGGGFLSQSPYTLHFGVGACERVESVTVRWPSGDEETWRDLPVGQRLALTQGEADALATALRPLNENSRAVSAEAQGVSAAAPELVLEGFGDAPEVRVADLSEGTAVINFWATWCTACIAEMPDLQLLADAYTPKGVRFLGIVMDERDKEAAAAKFLAGRGVSYPQAWGDVTTQAPFASLASVPAGAIPMTAILHGGLVRRVVAGAIDRAALSATLDRLLMEEGS